MAITDSKRKAKVLVSIMFDDGFKEVISIAAPMLIERNLVASIAVIGSQVGKNGYMDWSDYRQLLERGWTLADHSYSHLDASACSPEDLLEDIAKNRQCVKQNLNYEMSSFVFPKSRVKTSTLRAVLSVYPVAFTGSSKVYFNRFPVQKPLLTRTEVGFYEEVRSALSLHGYKKEFSKQLSKAVMGTDQSWLVLFFHKVSPVPKLFDSSVSLFSSVLNMITIFGLPVVLVDDAVSSSGLNLNKLEQSEYSDG